MNRETLLVWLAALLLLVVLFLVGVTSDAVAAAELLGRRPSVERALGSLARPGEPLGSR
ncbi:hypothetical protein ACFQE1_10850 [Halobium palmae]|uniref:Uncharacterized protein n=1 Tax=Halobium palmae TaxID=1776492 RepID=A0ABD5RZL3_9EURY